MNPVRICTLPLTAGTIEHDIAMSVIRDAANLAGITAAEFGQSWQALSQDQRATVKRYAQRFSRDEIIAGLTMLRQMITASGDGKAERIAYRIAQMAVVVRACMESSAGWLE